MKVQKIILIQPLHRLYPKKGPRCKRHQQIVFPFGIGYIASFLLNKGYEVEIFDIHGLLLDEDEVEKRIPSLKCDIIGISAFSTQYSYVKWLVELLKKELGVKIIIGGPLATHSYELVLKDTNADICVIGEGELTTLEILENMENLDKIKGIAYRKNGQVIKNPPQEYIKNLDTLLYPTYDLFQMDIYTNTKFQDVVEKSAKYSNLRIMGLICGRGCPFNCNFCSKNFKGLRLRSIDNIIDEIIFLKDKYNISGIHFVDELVVVSKRRIEKLTERIKPLNIKWDCQGRVDIIDYNILKKMKDAGCVSIGFGIESGSPKILKNMNKGITPTQIEMALKSAIKVGLDVKVQLIFGYPGETKETIAETINLFKGIGHPGRRFNLITPLPGTPIYTEALNKGLIKNEETYLDEISYNFGYGSVQVNFTEFHDTDLYSLMHKTVRTMLQNYRKYLIKHPILLAKKIISMSHPVPLIRRILRKIKNVVAKYNLG